MTPSPIPRRAPRRPRAGRALALGPGLAIAAVVTAIDVVAMPSTAIVGIVLLAPLLAALTGTQREVALVAAAAVALAIASGAWRDNLGEPSHVQRVLIVGGVGMLALLATRGRLRAARDRERFEVLAAIAAIADGSRTLRDTVEAIDELLVPLIADVCIVDAVREGRLERLAVRAAGSDPDAVAAMLAAAPPPAPLDDDDEPRLAERVSDELLRRVAVDADDLDRLRALEVVSAILVPLRARGRSIGALTLLVTTASRRRYGVHELEFACLLAGRVALALDNAGLFSELETIEAQLTAALETLAEAVTVQHPSGRLLYANAAAAQMFGFDSPQALLATDVGTIVARFDTFYEDGAPLRIDDLPGRRLVAGEAAPAPILVRTVDRASGDEHWRLTKATAVHDRAGAVKLIVNVIDDVTDVKRAELAQRLLARAGELLASSLDYERTLQRVAELAVPQLADWCAVSLPDGQGHVRTVAVAHVDAAKVAEARRIGERYATPLDAAGGIAEVMREGRSQVLGEISDELLARIAHDDEHLALLRSVGLRAGLTVPMTTPSGKIVGAISLVSAESGRHFAAADVALAEELARRAATAVENARLYGERSHIAHTLQASLLPGRLPATPGWSSATLYRPAGDENWVGGDFYDVFAAGDGWLALVGDVAGHGAEAAALTGLARYTLRTAATLLDDPLDAVARLNVELIARERMALCSVAAVLLHDDDDGGASAQIVSAGHPLPLLVRGQSVREVGSHAPMLGAYDVPHWRRERIALLPGDVLVLFTDGVLDAVGAHERFGEQRLARTLAGAADADDAIARIDRALSTFAVAEQADDTAVLAVQRLALEAGVGGRRRGGADDAAGR